MKKIMCMILVGILFISGVIGFIYFTSGTAEGAGLANSP